MHNDPVPGSLKVEANMEMFQSSYSQYLLVIQISCAIFCSVLDLEHPKPQGRCRYDS